MHVISQNSRRKASAEDERSNVLYCMHSTLQSVARSLKKRCTVSRPKMKIQGLSKQLPIFRCKVTDQYVRVLSKMTFKDWTSSCNFFAVYAPIWPLFSFKYRMSIILSLRNEHFSGFKIYTYTVQVCRKVVSLLLAKNISLLFKKGKLELRLLYTWSLKATVSVF